MHELSIVFNIIDEIVDIAKENNATKINELTLEIGEVSLVIPSYLEDCFEWAKKRNEMTKDIVLKIEIIKGVTICNNCNETYETTKYGKICPHCGSEDTVLLKGSEVNIKEIEVV